MKKALATMTPKISTLYGQCYDIYLTIQELRRNLRDNQSKTYEIEDLISEKMMEISKIQQEISSIEDPLQGDNTVIIYFHRLKIRMANEVIDVLRTQIMDNLQELTKINKKLNELEIEYNVGNM